jgi:hypothetical protein
MIKRTSAIGKADDVSPGRFLALLRSNARLKALMWTHRISSVGKPHPSSVSVQRRDHELKEVARAIKDVFYANMERFLKQLNSDRLLGIVEGGYNYDDVNSMFLRGIISELVERSPPLPTEPFDRVAIHLLGHFMNAEEKTLDEAREKVLRTEALYNEANQLFDRVVEMGREAYRTSRTDLLIECHKAACQSIQPASIDLEVFDGIEKEMALEVARIGGIVMREQFRVVAAVTGSDRTDEIIWGSQAFAFGILIAALRQKGIPWEKSPYVSVRFAEVYMPAYGNHIELANLILHFGIEPSYQKFRVAGELAFDRFGNSDEREPRFADDLARVLGLL